MASDRGVTLRIFLLFLLLCASALCFYTWQWGLGQQEHAQLLAEQSRLRGELAEGERRFSELTFYTTKTCQQVLGDMLARLGIDPSHEGIGVVQANAGLKAGGIGGGLPVAGGKKGGKVRGH